MGFAFLFCFWRIKKPWKCFCNSPLKISQYKIASSCHAAVATSCNHNRTSQNFQIFAKIVRHFHIQIKALNFSSDIWKVITIFSIAINVSRSNYPKEKEKKIPRFLYSKIVLINLPKLAKEVLSPIS